MRNSSPGTPKRSAGKRLRSPDELALTNKGHTPENKVAWLPGGVIAFIGVICISNKIACHKRLNERVDSPLQDNELVFDSYDADQLRTILDHRRDAFEDGVLEESVTPKTAALAACEHGDVRKAVDTLYEAGKLAEKSGSATVTEAHDALRQAESNRFQGTV